MLDFSFKLTWANQSMTWFLTLLYFRNLLRSQKSKLNSIRSSDSQRRVVSDEDSSCLSWSMVWLSLSFLQLIICECILRGNIFLSNPRPTLVNLDSHSSHGRLLSTFHYSFSSFYHQYYHYLTSPMKVINLSLFQERSPLQITASVKVSGEIHQALWSDRLVRSVLIPKFRLLKYC